MDRVPGVQPRQYAGARPAATAGDKRLTTRAPLPDRRRPHDHHGAEGIFQGLKLAYIGDGNNVSQFTAPRAAIVGMDFMAATSEHRPT